MAFPEGKFFQNGVDLVNLCESDYCGGLITSSNYYFKNDAFQFAGSTGLDDLDFKTDLYTDGSAIVFPKIGCCPIPRTNYVLSCNYNYKNSSNILTSPIYIEKKSDRVEVTSSIEGDTKSFLANDFYGNKLPDVVCIVLQGAGAGGSAGMGVNNDDYLVGWGGGAGGFAIVFLKLEENTPIRIDLGSGNIGGTKGAGGDGYPSYIYVDYDQHKTPVVTVDGGKGYRQVGSGHGGIGGDVVFDNTNEYLLQVVSCSGGDGGFSAGGNLPNFYKERNKVLDRTQDVYSASNVNGGAEFGVYIPAAGKYYYIGGGGASVIGNGGDAKINEGAKGGAGAGGGGSSDQEGARGGAGGDAYVAIYLGYPAEA